MIHVGTSGWQYRDWRGRFYPQGLSQREWLRFFSERFPVVEVNNTFYMLPKEETFVRWRQGSADGFTFVIKASRFITHIRRLGDARDAVRLMWGRCRRLGRKLGPVLFQLPPTLQADLDRLESFIRVLPPSMRAAFEFRHPSWDTGETHAVLDRHGCALVIPDRPGSRIPHVITGGWSYLRFHQGRRTGPGYPRAKLRRFADRLADHRDVETYVFFNNDPQGAAVRDAATLSALLRERGLDVRGPG
ncbi:MAG TPA: DUF72 domain-containing protein [Actinomycetota bacterium]|nr:DUF72 domain-containing protein [Actinomycetota bacterium]